MGRFSLSLRTLERALFVILLSMAIVFGLSIAYIISTLSSMEAIEKLEYFRNKIPTKVYDVKGRLFAEFFYQKREVIHFDKIPKNLVHALVAIEDNSFFSHGGIDVGGMFRALLVDVFTGSAKQGGSTITQQLAKRLFTESEKTIARKIRELWYALQIEKKYSKQEILELYCNEIYFGHGAYGIEAASQIYFQKSARDINLGECAILAALPSAPNAYSPIAFPEMARQRQRIVLLKMAEMGYITKQEADKAWEGFWEEYSQKNLAPTLSAWNVKIDKAPYFTEYIRQQLVDIYGVDRVNEDGLRVYTTLDLDMQQAGERVLQEKLFQMRTNYQRSYQVYVSDVRKKHLDPIDLISSIFDIGSIRISGVKTSTYVNDSLESTWKSPLLMLSFIYGLQGMNSVIDGAYNWDPKSSRGVSPEGALVAIDPRNGYVKTLIGGSEFSPENRFNRAVQAYRQPGSAFKPFVYLAAIESKDLTAGSALEDAPVAYEQANGVLWFPRNYDRHYSGRLVLRDALRWSVNIITVKILDKVGYRRVTKIASTLMHIPVADIEKRFVRAHSLALGGSEVTPYELCNAFAVLANEGQDVQPISLLKVYDRDGKLIDDFLRKRDYDKDERPKPNQQLVEKEPVYILTTMLEDVTADGTAAKAKEDAGLRRPIAGKTGTASNWKDVWFACYTPQIASTVWIGFDDPGISLGRGSSASDVAAPIVLKFMAYALRNEPERWYKPPAGVHKGSVCRVSGKAPTKACRKVYGEWFLEGTGPDGKCEECERIGSAITNYRGTARVDDGGTKRDPTRDDNGLSITGPRISTDNLFDD
ncbi:MAG TPA: PBP1A family penicillin-binding protein [Spirochaetota bacterium]|nr:PBP1A family penicillin-binding protein [Spirochaetota bacterium]